MERVCPTITAEDGPEPEWSEMMLVIGLGQGPREEFPELMRTGKAQVCGKILPKRNVPEPQI